MGDIGERPMQRYKPVYRKGAYDYPEFAGYAGAEIRVQGSRYRYDQDSGSYVYEGAKPAQLARQPGPDPELELYTAVTGRWVYTSFTHASWRNEYAATGQSIAMERMLALVTETTHCDALDGPVTPVPAVRQHRLSELQLGALIGLAIFVIGILIIFAL